MNKVLVFAVSVAAIGLLFSCSSDTEPTEQKQAESSSSGGSSSSIVLGISSGGSSQGGLVLCDFGGGVCAEISAGLCFEHGKVVESCPKTGNSSSAQPSSSSSSLPSGSVFCVISGICAEVSGEVCALLSGTAVQSCPVSSSSGVAPSSSSSALPSSSSVVPSSSSYVDCSGFIEGTEREHYGKMKKQFCDERDGKRYVYVVIGEQTWMAENLNYAAEGSKCASDSPQYPGLFLWLADNNTAYCDTYGRFYDWSTAMGLPSSCNENICSSQIQTKHRGVCPSGWHLPNEEDWEVMTAYIGGASTEGKKLKTTSGWNDFNGPPRNGTDEYGFSALPGGMSFSNGGFDGANYGYWWGAIEGNFWNAYYRNMNGIDYAEWVWSFKDNLYSVRCLQD